MIRKISSILFVIGVALMIAGPIILYTDGESVDNAAISVIVSVYGLNIALFSLLWSTLRNMNDTLRDNSYMVKMGIKMLEEVRDVLKEVRDILKGR